MPRYLLAQATGENALEETTEVEPPDEWQPYVQPRLRASNRRNLGTLDFFLPLTQNENSMLFADLRGMYVEGGNSELNAGVGYRWLTPEQDRIWGVYGFFDARNTEHDNNFEQFTFGVETLTDTWDLRANAYFPTGRDVKDTFATEEVEVSQSQQVNVSTSTQNFPQGLLEPKGHNVKVIQSITRGTRTTTTTTTTTTTDRQFREAAMTGADVEVGRRIPFIDPVELRGYLGAYHFTHADSEDDATGWRARLEARVNDYVTLGVETQDDDLFGSETSGELRLRIPLGKRPEYLPESEGGRALRDRMTDPIVRDLDIVVTEKVPPIVDTHVEQVVDVQKEHFSRESSELLLKFFPRTPLTINHVDNSNDVAGDGTFEAPFRRLADAAGTTDIIYVNTGSGSYSSGIVLSNGQRLIGEGYPLVVSGITESGMVIFNRTLFPAGEFPQITTVLGSAVTLANNNEVAGVNATFNLGGGVVGTNVTGFDIHDNEFTLNTDGVNITTNGDFVSEGEVVGNRFILNLASAVSFTTMDNSSLTAEVRGNLMLADSVGVSNTSDNDSSLNVNVFDNLMLANQAGVLNQSSGNDGSRLHVSVVDNIIIAAQQAAVASISSELSAINVQVQANIINNGTEGVVNLSSDQSKITANIIGNEIYDNASNAVGNIAQGQSSINANIVQNVLTGNAAGIANVVSDTGQITELADRNTVNNNVNAIANIGNDNGVMDLTLLTNTIQNNRTDAKSMGEDVQGIGISNILRGSSMLSIFAENNLIDNNEVGMASILGNSTDAIVDNPILQLEFLNNTFTNNRTDDTLGGMDLQGLGVLTIANESSTFDAANTFYGNVFAFNEFGFSTITNGDAVADIHLTDNLFEYNTTDDLDAGGNGVQGVAVASLSNGASTLDILMDADVTGNIIRFNEAGVAGISNGTSTFTGTYDSLTVHDNRTDDVSAGGGGQQGAAFTHLSNDSSTMDLSNTISNSSIFNNETGAVQLANDTSTLSVRFLNNMIVDNVTDDLTAGGDGVQGVGVASVSNDQSNLTLVMQGDTVSNNEAAITNIANGDEDLILGGSTFTGTLSGLTVTNNRTDDTLGGVDSQGIGILNKAAHDATLGLTLDSSTLSQNEQAVVTLAGGSSDVDINVGSTAGINAFNNTTDDVDGSGGGVQGLGMLNARSGSSDLDVTVANSSFNMNEAGVVNTNSGDATQQMTVTLTNVLANQNLTDDVDSSAVDVQGLGIGNIASSAGVLNVTVTGGSASNNEIGMLNLGSGTSDLDVTVSGLTASNNTTTDTDASAADVDGIGIVSVAQGTTDLNISVTGSTANSNELGVVALGTAGTLTSSVTNSVANLNDLGIALIGTGGTINPSTVSGNVANNNATNESIGILNFTNGSSFQVDVDGNTANNNSYGIASLSQGGTLTVNIGTTTGNVTGSNDNDNDNGAGIATLSQGGTVIADIQNNVANFNDVNIVSLAGFDDTAGSAMQLNVQNNTANSSDAGIATVGIAGTLTGIGGGNVTITGNVANGNNAGADFGAGIVNLTNGIGFGVDIQGNTANSNDAGIANIAQDGVLTANVGTVTGNVANNNLENGTGAGIANLAQGDSLVANVFNNLTNSNDIGVANVSAFQNTSGNLTLSLQNNTANNNDVGFASLAQGGSGDTLTANIGTVTGNVANNNTNSGTGAGIANLTQGGTMVANVFNNVTNSNDIGVASLSAFQNSSGNLTLSLQGNTANSNEVGFANVAQGTTSTTLTANVGTVTGNVANLNTNSGDGAGFANLSQGGTLLADVQNNVANSNDTGIGNLAGFQNGGGVLELNLQNNTTNNNDAGIANVGLSGTFTGLGGGSVDVTGNVANGNNAGADFGAGIVNLANGISFTVDVQGNTANSNDAGITNLSQSGTLTANVGTVTGNVANLNTEAGTGAGIANLTQGGVLIANVSNNLTNSNDIGVANVSAFQGTSGNLTLSLQNNTANSNQVGFAALAQGTTATTLTANIGTVTGNVANLNTNSGDGAGFANLTQGGTLIANVQNNLANSNDTGIGSIAGFQNAGGQLQLNLNNNTTNSNDVGVANVGFSGSFTGIGGGAVDVTNNVANGNNAGADFGAGIVNFTDGVSYTVSVQGNTANSNDAGITNLSQGGTLTANVGTISGNVANNNTEAGTGAGIANLTQGGTLIANVSNNTTNSNDIGVASVSAFQDTSGNLTVSLQNNTANSNNVGFANLAQGTSASTLTANVGTTTGNVTNNNTDGGNGAGIANLTDGGRLIANVQQNVANGNDTGIGNIAGFQEGGGNLQVNVQNNTTNSNGTGIANLGDSGSFTGIGGGAVTVTGNVANSNTADNGIGIGNIADGVSYTVSVQNNTTNSNHVGIANLSLSGTLTANVGTTTGNVANLNTDSGSGAGIANITQGGTLNANINGNTANDNDVGIAGVGGANSAGGNLQLSAQGNTANSNNDGGIVVLGQSGTTNAFIGTTTGNLANSNNNGANEGTGIAVVAQGGTTDADIRNNTTNFNDVGIALVGQGGTFSSPFVNNNTANQNDRAGILVFGDGISFTATVNNSRASDNGEVGIVFYNSSDPTTLTANASGNVVSDTGSGFQQNWGLVGYADNNSSISVNFQNNSATGHSVTQGVGIALVVDGASAFGSGTISGNTVSGNDNGIVALGIGPGSFSGNYNILNLTISNNQASSNDPNNNRNCGICVVATDGSQIGNNLGNTIVVSGNTANSNDIGIGIIGIGNESQVGNVGAGNDGEIQVLNNTANNNQYGGSEIDEGSGIVLYVANSSEGNVFTSGNVTNDNDIGMLRFDNSSALCNMDGYSGSNSASSNDEYNFLDPGNDIGTGNVDDGCSD